ncbi:MAG: Spy/CpxP family protein refolding chaperone [Thermoanaerobaculales bacterium]
MTNTAMRWILGSAMMVGAAVVVAQPLGIPPGRWWEQPKVAEQLALTADQTQQLNTLTLGHARTMVDLKGSVEKAEIDLRAAAETDPLDAKQVRQNFAALQQTRMRLESERFDMLLKVRQVLTTEQWHKLRDIVRERRDRGEAMGGEAGRKPLRRWRN